jgi:2,4-diaminopentanoate dehydrogenase
MARDSMRTVIVGIGQIAASLVACARAQGHTIVGAVDTDPAKAGLDVGELLGLSTEGVVVVQAIEEVAAQADVAIVATSSSVECAAPALRACMQRGWNVVSTCEELAYPWRNHPVLAGELDAEAIAAGVTLVGTGINPGFVLDTLILAASAPCWNVRAVRGRRVLDAGTRRASFRDKVGVGMTQEEFRAAAAKGGFGHAGLADSAWLVADRLDLAAAHVTEGLEPELDAAGLVAGSRQFASLATADGREVVRLEMVMATGVSEPQDVIELDANPPIHLVLKGGVPGDAGTAGVLLNAARRLADAQSGLRTMDELPIACAVAAEAAA